MTGERKARVVTIAVLAAALGIGLARKNGWSLPNFKPSRIADTRTEENPQDAIYSMLNAARTGDVKAYLASFTGSMETSLKQTLAETTKVEFSRYLRESNASIKGIAVSEPRKVTDLEVAARVEYVYQERNEVQTMYLEKRPQGWKISRVDTQERVKTQIPYGTPVK
jgi:hypothetical protein